MFCQRQRIHRHDARSRTCPDPCMTVLDLFVAPASRRKHQPVQSQKYLMLLLASVSPMRRKWTLQSFTATLVSKPNKWIRVSHRQVRGIDSVDFAWGPMHYRRMKSYNFSQARPNEERQSAVSHSMLNLPVAVAHTASTVLTSALRLAKRFKWSFTNKNYRPLNALHEQSHDMSPHDA